MSMTLLSSVPFESEQTLQLISDANDRVTNGRIGDRALNKIIQLQERNIKSLIRKRMLVFPTLEFDDLYTAAVEGIIQRLPSYDPMKGTLSTWLFNGIRHGLDRLCNQERKTYQAKKSAERNLQVAHHDTEAIPFISDELRRHIANLKTEVQQIIQLVCEGYRFTEIGELLGKSPDAVRMAFNRAIASLRKALTPKFRFTRRWFRNALGGVVRKFAETRKQSRTTKARFSLPMNLKAIAKKWRSPLDRWYYGTLTSEGRWFVAYASSFLFSLLLSLSMPSGAYAQDKKADDGCLGWMCGPANTLIQSVFFEDAGTKGLLTGFFVFIQLVLVLMFMGILIWAFYNASKERSVSWPIIIMFLYLGLVFGSNYAGGLTVSNVNADGIGFK